VLCIGNGTNKWCIALNWVCTQQALVRVVTIFTRYRFISTLQPIYWVKALFLLTYDSIANKRKASNHLRQGWWVSFTFLRKSLSALFLWKCSNVSLCWCLIYGRNNWFNAFASYTRLFSSNLLLMRVSNSLFLNERLIRNRQLSILLSTSCDSCSLISDFH
jgi:hypothetical protein